MYGTDYNKIKELFLADKRKRKIGFWKKHLNKTHLTRMVIEKINYQKTQASEAKYLQEAIYNGYILEVNHPTDSRQKVLFPSVSTIKDVENWLDVFK